MSTIFQGLHQALLRGEEAILVTAYEREGPRRTLHLGAALAAFEGRPEAAATPRLEKNGELVTLVELFRPKPRLVIFGGGHVTLALAPLAATLGYRTVIYDDRPTFSNPFRFPQAAATICDSFEAIGRHVELRPGDLAVIVTRGHRHDLECLDFVMAGPEPFYVGLIGSRRRIAVIRKGLAARGLDLGRLERLHAPIGLDIGAVTPEEIALAIMAEIVQVKRASERERGLGRQEIYADLELTAWLAQPPPAEGAALITVTATSGSTPRKAGAKMAALFDGRAVGSIGGGCAEAGALAAAREIIGSGRHEIKTVDLTDSAEEDGMVCGGRMELLLEDLD
ncbi:MAG: XdhC family protein [Deltaproteobacteria bacterium]|jgi:xanthine dehydrogenase accessory factor|nr:XdhC family protein [Deltaproteobacteria bacterium]